MAIRGWRCEAATSVCSASLSLGGRAVCEQHEATIRLEQLRRDAELRRGLDRVLVGSQKEKVVVDAGLELPDFPLSEQALAEMLGSGFL